jgi:hypothetical protein
MTVTINGTTGIAGVDGSAGTPAVQGADTNTGMFFPAADTIAFAEGGVEVARFNADAQFVTTAGTASLPVITTIGDVNTGIFFPAADTIAFAEGGTEVARINSSGNVILGSNTSTTANNVLNLWSPTSTLNGIYMQKSGQVEVQIGFKASTNTDFYIGTGSTTMGTYGVYLANTGTSWISVSDERQKDIIEPIENGLTKVSAIRAVIGKYKHDADGVRRSFLIAQDVQAVFPEAVKVQEDEEALLGLSYTDVIPLLVAAIKEQQALITALTARITALEAN